MLTRAYLSGKIILLAFVLIVFYSYLLAPDWMYMYFVKASDVPAWIVFYILVLYFFAYDAGFFLKFALEKMHRSFPAIMILLMLAAAVVVVLPLKNRYLSVGTLEQFRSGHTVPLSESAVGKVPGILSAFLLPLGLGLLIWSRRQRFSN